MTRNINNTAFEAIIRFEGLKLKSYLCPAKIWTIGVGHTGPDVKPGMVITKAEAYKMLDKDLDYFEDSVTRMIDKPMTDNEFGAMVMLAFNIGTGNPKSTKRIGFYWSGVRRLFLEGKKELAAEAFNRYNKAKVNGVYQVLSGLVKRRAFESKLFLTPDEKTDTLRPLIELIKELNPLELHPFDIPKKSFFHMDQVSVPQFSPFTI